MIEYKIPVPNQPSTEANDLTKLEIADLTPARRNTLLYERSIEQLKKNIDYLQKKLDSSDDERRVAINKLDTYIDRSHQAPLLKRENFEMYVLFALMTVSMTIGSALISSYPKTEAGIPWLFGLGWGLVGTGSVFGIFGKPLVWVFYKLSKSNP